MKRSHWIATLAWAVVSLPWGLQGCSSHPDSQEQVSQMADPIHASSCDNYLTTGHSCSRTPPTPAQCQRRGMPDGQGWDRCKYDPKVKNNPQICPQRNPTDPTDVDCKPGGGPCGACPAPGTKNGRPCVQGIFGRLNDGFRYYGCPGYVVINLPNGAWNQGVNDMYEDCFMSGGFGANMCDPPMNFVSDQNDHTTTTGIPDYNPSPTDGRGSITAQEWCRALVCGKCTMTSTTCYRTVNGKRTAYPCTKPQSCGGKPDSGPDSSGTGRPDATGPRRPGKRAPRPKAGAMAMNGNAEALSTCPDVWGCQACDGNTCSATPADPAVATSWRAKTKAIAIETDATVFPDATTIDDDASPGDDAADLDAGPPDDGGDPTCTGMCDECDANDTSFTPGDGVCEDGEDSEDCVCNLVPEDDTDDGLAGPQLDDR